MHSVGGIKYHNWFRDGGYDDFYPGSSFKETIVHKKNYPAAIVYEYRGFDVFVSRFPDFMVADNGSTSCRDCLLPFFDFDFSL